MTFPNLTRPLSKSLSQNKAEDSCQMKILLNRKLIYKQKFIYTYCKKLLIKLGVVEYA